MGRTRGFAFAVLLASACAWAAPADALAVDLELALYVDSSSSVSFDEFFLQTRGLASAFRSEPVIAAIRRVGGIAVTVIQFSSADRQRTAIAWTHLAGAETAAALADALERAPRYVTGGTTAIGSAISSASIAFRDNGFEGARLVIDVSGDGRSNEGVLTSFARDRAVGSGITTNPGRFSFTDPRPLFTHDPRHGLPDKIRPEFIISIADPCSGLSAYIDLMNAMSSTQVARCGNRSETHAPHCPYCLNFHLGPTTRP